LAIDLIRNSISCTCIPIAAILLSEYYTAVFHFSKSNLHTGYYIMETWIYDKHLYIVYILYKVEWDITSELW
jgi:hypothetical protein